MSSITPAATGPATAPSHDAELAREVAEEVRQHHPSDSTYIVVALVLGGLTAIEVALYYLKLGSLNTLALLALMAVKFVIVAGFFMHLRFDSKIFRRLFIVGLVLATFVYSVTFFTLGVFHI